MRKTTAQDKKTAGTHRPDRVKQKITIRPQTERPPAPSWLSETGKEYFDSMAGLLASNGLLSALDVDLLGILAGEMGRYVEAYRAMQTEGSVVRLPNGYFKISQYAGICKESMRAVSDLAPKMGISLRGRETLGLELDTRLNPNDQQAVMTFAQKYSTDELTKLVEILGNQLTIKNLKDDKN